MHDAIVIGARCAGASTAMLLARAGHSVLLVDRARFPSEIPHGHFIHRHGPARLSRWGLLDRVLATGCLAITSLLVDFGDFPLAGHELVVDGVPVGLGPRRGALDGVLVNAAVEAGTEIREGFVVDELVFDDGRVVGIDGRSGGKRVRELARFVIGADGRNSGVAKRVRAPAYDAVPTLSIWYFSYWSGVPGEALELYQRGRRIVFAFPTNDELHAVFVGWPAAELGTARRNPEEALLAAVDLFPELAERVRGGRREERSSARRTCRTSRAGAAAPAGRWSATLAATRTRISPTASVTPSATQSCSPMHSARSFRMAAAKPRCSASTSVGGTRRRWRTTAETSRRLS